MLFHVILRGNRSAFYHSKVDCWVSDAATGEDEEEEDGEVRVPIETDV